VDEDVIAPRRHGEDVEEDLARDAGRVQEEASLRATARHQVGRVRQHPAGEPVKTSLTLGAGSCRHVSPQGHWSSVRMLRAVEMMLFA
jgi:hypothetical protein